METKTEKSFVKHPLIRENTIEYRIYQEEIVKKILEKGNTLVVAPTAIGKTVIAALLIAEVLRRDQDSKVLLVAPTKPLAEQHKKSFCKFLNIDENKIVLLTGSINANKRKEIFEDASVICATPQSIENNLVSKEISFEDISLLIFDEAHRAVGNYSYVKIAKEYSKIENGLIVGLTASPGHHKERIQDVCKNLFIDNIEIKSREDSDVKAYLKEIEISWIKVNLPPEFAKIKENLNKFMHDQLEFFSKIGYNKIRIKRMTKKQLLDMQNKIVKNLEKNSEDKPYLYQAVTKIAALLKISHADTLLETQGIYALRDYLNKLFEEAKQSTKKVDKLIISSDEIRKAKYLCDELIERNIDHPKIDVLKNILVAQFKENPESRVLVFNHYRDSLKNLELHLSKLENVRVRRFVGQATKGEDRGLKQREQVQIIEDFKKGIFNTLLCSSVAEEGIDIPSVDLVIFYEPVPSEIRTIQRRGRTGRFEKGKVIILITKGTKDEAFYWTAVAKEKKMKKMLFEIKNDITLNKYCEKQKFISENKENDNDELTKNLKGQKKLLDFFDNNQNKTIKETKKEQQEKPLLVVDYREQSNEIVKIVSKNCEVKFERLEVGDYQITDEIIVERKTIHDFLQSLIDGRLFEQADSLIKNFKKPLIVVEGDFENIYTERNIHKNAIISALSSLILNYKIPIFPSKNQQETAEILYNIARREQLGKEKEFRLRTGKKGYSLTEKQQFIVESLPSVGPILAKKLLKHFKTIRAIANADEHKLCEVENIGEQKAKNIYEVFNEEYKEEY